MSTVTLTHCTHTVRAAASCVIGHDSLLAQSGIPDLNYSSVDLLKTPPNVYVGEVGGVGANSKGQIFVYTRTGHPYATLGDNRTFSHGGSRLLMFDASGKFVSEWGQDVYGFNAAIGLRVDPQDNVWTIDVAANQVVKFNPDGSIGLVLGRKPEAIGVRPNAPPAGGGEGRGGPGAGCRSCPAAGAPAQRRRAMLLRRRLLPRARVAADSAAARVASGGIGHSGIGLQPSD